jgi:hypothetical protein
VPTSQPFHMKGFDSAIGVMWQRKKKRSLLAGVRRYTTILAAESQITIQSD